MNDAAEPIGKTKIRCRANEQQIQQQVIASNEILQRTVRTLSERGLASTRSHSPEKRNSRWRHDARPSSRGCQKRTSGPGRMPRVQVLRRGSGGLARNRRRAVADRTARRLAALDLSHGSRPWLLKLLACRTRRISIKIPVTEPRHRQARSGECESAQLRVRLQLIAFS